MNDSLLMVLVLWGIAVLMVVLDMISMGQGKLPRFRFEVAMTFCLGILIAISAIVAQGAG